MTRTFDSIVRTLDCVQNEIAEHAECLKKRESAADIPLCCYQRQVDLMGSLCRELREVVARMQEGKP